MWGGVIDVCGGGCDVGGFSFYCVRCRMLGG